MAGAAYGDSLLSYLRDWLRKKAKNATYASGRVERFFNNLPTGFYIVNLIYLK